MSNLNDLVELSFKNNPNLRPCNAQIAYTPDMVREITKCMKDPIYFIENYVHVIHPDRGSVLMKLYDYQKEMVSAYHDNRKVCGMASRQLGKTTTAAAYIVWLCLFNDEKSVGILANKQAQAFEIMDRVRFAIECLPKWLQQGIKRWNRGSFELENGSKCFGAATSKNAIRGRALQILYLDEFAFVQNTQAEEFFTSVFPTISASKESKMIITSTPNGFNHFYKIWNEAETKKNGFTPIKSMWWQHPERDQEWYEEQKAVLGELKTAQELDCEFQGSSRQLLTAATMAALSPIQPIKEYSDQFKGLKIYRPPEKGHSYTMTVDVSRGRHLDASAFLIFDISDYPHRIVASYNNNDIAPLKYAGLCYQIAKQYNEAYVLIEINDVGAQVAEEMYYTYEYEGLYWTKSGDQLGKKGADPYPGIRTTKKTKRIGCANLKDIAEKKQIIIDDMACIQQLSTFVQNDSGSWEADEGFNDDMVACLWLYAWLATQAWFVDLYDKSMRNQMYASLEKELEDELAPALFIHNAANEYEDNPNMVNSREAMELLL